MLQVHLFGDEQGEADDCYRGIEDPGSRYGSLSDDPQLGNSKFGSDGEKSGRINF